MKNTSCDHCGRKFTKRDDYIKAHITLSYTQYEGDDGSTNISRGEDLCEECLTVVRRFFSHLVGSDR